MVNLERPLRARWPLRRAHRPGPRRRRREGPEPALAGARGRALHRAAARASNATWSPRGRVAVDGVSPDRRRARAGVLHGRPDPVYTGRDEPAATCGGGTRVNLEVDVIAKYVERARIAARTQRARAASSSPMTEEKKTAFVEPALEDVRAGRMIVIVDDEDRENEGDLMVAAEKVTPEVINFMARHGRGLDLPAADGRALRGAAASRSWSRTARTRPVSGRPSASPSTPSRARPRASPRPTGPGPSSPPSTRGRSPDDLARPGHMFPLRAAAGRRPGAGRPDRGRRGPGPPGRALSRPGSSARS